MISFLFKKSSQKNIRKSLNNKFPWINKINNQIDELIDQDINLRIKEITDLHTHFFSTNGKKELKKLQDGLINLGYPKKAAAIELNLFIKIFDKTVINNLLFNPSAGLNIHKKNSKFKTDKLIMQDFGILRSPKGKILIVGSGNTLLPVITSMVLSYIVGNVTVVQLSSLHINLIPDFIKSFPLNISQYVHFTKLNHNNLEDKYYLQLLLVSINWDVANLWGGDESIKYYLSELSKNTYRPRIVSMEPLTGVTLIQNKYIKKKAKQTAKELAHSIFIMGQQLCSSPTIGFIISNDMNEADESIKNFSKEIILELEKKYDANYLDERSSIMLDRMLNSATDCGSIVHRSDKFKNNICIIESKNNSIFTDNKDNNFLKIHERSNFIELIKVQNFKEVIKQIRLLPNLYSYKDIQKVQTILPFGDEKFIKQVFILAKKIGAYRVIDAEYTLLRHSLEPLDSYNLINEFTTLIAVSGKNSINID